MCIPVPEWQALVASPDLNYRWVTSELLPYIGVVGLLVIPLLRSHLVTFTPWFTLPLPLLPVTPLASLLPQLSCASPLRASARPQVFVLLTCEFGLVRLTSSLTLSLLGVAKELITILVAGAARGDIVTPTNLSGFLLCAAGILGYQVSPPHPSPPMAVPRPAVLASPDPTSWSYRVLVCQAAKGSPSRAASSEEDADATGLGLRNGGGGSREMDDCSAQDAPGALPDLPRSPFRDRREGLERDSDVANATARVVDGGTESDGEKTGLLLSISGEQSKV